MIEVQRCQRAGDRLGEGRAFDKLGSAFFRLGQHNKHNKAIEFHTKNLDISRELGKRNGECCALGNLGAAYHSTVKSEAQENPENNLR